MNYRCIHAIRENNCYYNDNPKMFDELVELIENYRKTYGRTITTTRKYLLNWILNSLQQYCKEDLSHTTFPTKCYWIIKGIVDRNSDLYKCHYEKCKHINEPIRDIDNIIVGYHEFCCMECLNKSEKHKKHVAQSLIDHFGVDTPTKCKEIADKAVQSHYINNGGKYFSDATIEQIFQTREDRYGDRNYNNRPLSAKTKMERYGDPTYGNTEKGRQTRYQKNGEGNFHSKEYLLQWASKAHHKYLYNGQKYDSLPEVAFAIYCDDHHVKYTYHDPNVYFEYEYEGKIHYYHPDFIVGNKIVEIKGDQFFLNKDVTSRMVCPYDHTLDDKFEALHQCMLKNGIKLYTTAIYDKYLKYVDKKYGKNYIKKNFKLKTKKQLLEEQEMLNKNKKK